MSALEMNASVIRAHLDFPRELCEVKGELELRVGELAAAGVGGIWTDYRSGPLKEIDTILQPEHLRRALDGDMKIKRWLKRLKTG